MTQAKSTRHEQRRQRTKEAIIVAASEAFLKKGVAGTTVTDITEAADVGYGTFYNHFHSLNDVISAVAEWTMLRVAQTAQTILPEKDILELAPAVGVRVLIRLFAKEPAIRWLLENPYVFVDEWHRVITPGITELLERSGPTSPQAFGIMGGLGTWLRIYPWIVVSELNDAIEKGSSAAHEENMANLALHLLGLDNERRALTIEASRTIVDAATAPSARRRGRPKAQSK